LGRVDRAFFQRRIDVAAGELLRHDAELLHNLSGKTADAEFQAVQIGDRLDLLAEPAAHLATGVASEDRDHVIALVELVEHLLAAAMDIPGLIQSLVGSARYA